LPTYSLHLFAADFGKHGMTSSPKLFAFDLKKKDELVKEYAFPSSVAGFGSMLNDFQVQQLSIRQ